MAVPAIFVFLEWHLPAHLILLRRLLRTLLLTSSFIILLELVVLWHQILLGANVISRVSCLKMSDLGKPEVYQIKKLDTDICEEKLNDSIITLILSKYIECQIARWMKCRLWSINIFVYFHLIDTTFRKKSDHLPPTLLYHGGGQLAGVICIFTFILTLVYKPTGVYEHLLNVLVTVGATKIRLSPCSQSMGSRVNGRSVWQL